MTIEDCISIFNGLGICDSCGNGARKGYYVPILNYYMCKDCFNRWRDECIYYEDDLWFEKGYVKFVDSAISRSDDIMLVDFT